MRKGTGIPCGARTVSNGANARVAFRGVAGEQEFTLTIGHMWPAGSVEVEMRAPRFLPFETTVTLPLLAPVEFTVRLGAVLFVRATDEDGHPATRRHVRICPDGEEERSAVSGRTNVEGEFRARLLPGKFRIRVGTRDWDGEPATPGPSASRRPPSSRAGGNPRRIRASAASWGDSTPRVETPTLRGRQGQSFDLLVTRMVTADRNRAEVASSTRPPGVGRRSAARPKSKPRYLVGRTTPGRFSDGARRMTPGVVFGIGLTPARAGPPCTCLTACVGGRFGPGPKLGGIRIPP